jgi:hypothetical protein
VRIPVIVILLLHAAVTFVAEACASNDTPVGAPLDEDVAGDPIADYFRTIELHWNTAD